MHPEVGIQIADVKHKRVALMIKKIIHCLTLNNRGPLLWNWIRIGKVGQEAEL